MSIRLLFARTGILRKHANAMLIIFLLFPNAGYIFYFVFSGNHNTEHFEHSGFNASWRPLHFHYNPDLPEQVFISYVGVDANVDIEFTNISHELLYVKSHRVSCSCTHVGIDKLRLNPLETAVLTGTIRSTLEPSVRNIRINVEVVGSESGRTNWIELPFSVEFLSSVDIENNLADYAPSSDISYVPIGNLSLHNRYDKDVEVEIQTIRTENVSFQPTQFTLKSGSSRIVFATLNKQEEAVGFVRIVLDAGREVHQVPLRIDSASKLKVYPSVLILGTIKPADDGQLASSFPATLTVRGGLLNDHQLLVSQLADVLDNPQYSYVGPEELKITFDISQSASNIGRDDIVQIDAVSESGDVAQSLKINVIGFIKN
jgi:hypothetical protein